jgi:putative addiction module component (TIGR02574 family)
MENEKILQSQDIWDDEAFLKELDLRIKELESGKVKGSTWEEVKAKF